MDIFQDFLRHFLEVFIDDFAVFSIQSEHLGFLKKLLSDAEKRT